MPLDERVARLSYEAGMKGDLGAVDAALEALDGDLTPMAAALRVTFRAQRWFAAAVPAGAEGPETWELERFVDADADVRSVAALAAAHLVRARVLCFDVLRLREATELMARLVAGLEAGEATGWHAIARAWCAVADRRAPDADLEAVGSGARQDGHADLVIAATALRALLTDDVDAALSLARKASRMARTESIPQLEYLAHLVLARIRRLSGRPHLATHIISALLRVATPAWSPWLRWELALAQGVRGTEKTQVHGEAVRRLAVTLQAARTGARDAFDAGAQELVSYVRGFAPLATDVSHLLPCVDPTAELLDAPADVRAFCLGEVDQAPRGLPGLCGGEEPGAWVLATRTATPRRVLAPGLLLARALTSGAAERDGSGKQLRTDSAVALLALAGRDGLDEGDMFRRLYGFAYEPDRHQQVRGVLYGRIRKRIGEQHALVREEGRVRLEGEADLLVPDPRCAPPAEQRILTVLAECRHAAPKEVASALGIPLRTAQEALRRLSEDGALRSEKASRGLHYILEDTTFSEPTRSTKR